MALTRTWECRGSGATSTVTAGCQQKELFSPRASPVMKDKMASCSPDCMQKDMEERLPKQSRTFQSIFERLRDEQ